MMIDNHVWSAGSITKAVQQARSAGGFSIKIEVEARSLEEALEAVRSPLLTPPLPSSFGLLSPLMIPFPPLPLLHSHVRERRLSC